MTTRLLDDRDDLEPLFDELADEFSRLRLTADIVMVGGAWLLWHARRSATRDVDSARRLDPRLGTAIEAVAARHDLSPDWLNDAAASFWPADASYTDCGIIYEQPALVVRVPAPEVIFVMKLYRASAQDREDLVTLWPLCSFTGPEEAANACWNAYPHAPDDEYLASYIADIARDASTD